MGNMPGGNTAETAARMACFPPVSSRHSQNLFFSFIAICVPAGQRESERESVSEIRRQRRRIGGISASCVRARPIRDGPPNHHSRLAFKFPRLHPARQDSPLHEAEIPDSHQPRALQMLVHPPLVTNATKPRRGIPSAGHRHSLVAHSSPPIDIWVIFTPHHASMHAFSLQPANPPLHLSVDISFQHTTHASSALVKSGACLPSPALSSYLAGLMLPLTPVGAGTPSALHCLESAIRLSLDLEPTLCICFPRLSFPCIVRIVPPVHHRNLLRIKARVRSNHRWNTC